MKNLIIWSLICITIISLVIFREPNVESTGVMIQEALYKDEQPDRIIDIVLMGLFISFFIVTIAILL